MDAHISDSQILGFWPAGVLWDFSLRLKTAARQDGLVNISNCGFNRDKANNVEYEDEDEDDSNKTEFPITYIIRHPAPGIRHLAPET